MHSRWLTSSMSLLEGLGVSRQVTAAPMAGGPSGPRLVLAAARAGSLGLLAGGYKTPTALADQVAEVRASGVAFGVNLFVPAPVPVDPERYAAYAGSLAADAEAYGVDPTAVPITEDDDWWPEKVDLLVKDPVPLVSFTFGLPDRETFTRLRRAGSILVQTITSSDEARAAEEAGMDALVVQSHLAGGHLGTFTPEQPFLRLTLAELVGTVRAAVRTPLWAAGGIGTAEDVRAAIDAGADAVAVGTMLLRAPEAGTSTAYRQALADGADRERVVTRAFSGRPAGGLRNGFVDAHDADAPSGYPALHHLTSPLRRAATDAGDPELVNLWAGAGFRHTTEAPVAELLDQLTP